MQRYSCQWDPNQLTFAVALSSTLPPGPSPTSYKQRSTSAHTKKEKNVSIFPLMYDDHSKYKVCC